MRWLILLTFCLGLFLPRVATAAAVRVCVYDNPPLSFSDDKGQAQGLFPELLTAVANKQDWQLKFISSSWSDCLQQLESGTIDILPAIAYTEERARKFRYAEETVLTNWGQIYQRQGAELDIIFKLSGLKLAVLKNDVHYVGAKGIRNLARNYDVTINFIEVDNYLEAFKLLAADDVDAALVNRFFGLKQQQQFSVQPTPILLNPIQIRPAFSPTSPIELQTDFDRSLSAWKKQPNSTYFQLINKWIADGSGTAFPAWLKLVFYGLAGLLCLVSLIAFWTRKQVKDKTLQLAEKNRQLEDELTERQLVEKELREREQQYRVLYEDTRAIMLLIDPKSKKIVDANPAACEFYGYPRNELQGMEIARLNRLSTEEIHEKATDIESRDLLQFEIVHYLASGEKRQVEIQSSPIQVEGRSLICSIVRDISQRKLAEQTLAERNIFLQSVLDSVADPLMVVDLSYQVLQMNKAAQERIPAALALEKTLQNQKTPTASEPDGDAEEHLCPLEEVRQTGGTVTLIHTHLGEQSPRLIELNASPLYNSYGEMYAIIEIARDITERQKIEELLSANEKRLHHMAHHDSLTDLPNRLLFEDRLKQALSKARRTRKQVALMFLDLDHFKDINDNLGHDFGDLLLVDIAGRLRGCVRESDTVARMGGDEFLVLLDDIDSIEMIETMAERVCEALTHQLTRNEYSQQVSASIGISIYPDDGVTGPEMMKNADIAMYRAKDQGKANYQFFSPPQGRLPFN